MAEEVVEREIKKLIRDIVKLKAKVRKIRKRARLIEGGELLDELYDYLDAAHGAALDIYDLIKTLAPKEEVEEEELEEEV